MRNLIWDGESTSPFTTFIHAIFVFDSQSHHDKILNAILFVWA